MGDWDDIGSLAPVLLVVVIGALKWLRRVQRSRAEMPQPTADHVGHPRSSKRDEIDFERDYEPLEPR